MEGDRTQTFMQELETCRSDNAEMVVLKLKSEIKVFRLLALFEVSSRV